jgi:hypothetical protein
LEFIRGEKPDQELLKDHICWTYLRILLIFCGIIGFISLVPEGDLEYESKDDNYFSN